MKKNYKSLLITIFVAIGLIAFGAYLTLFAPNAQKDIKIYIYKNNSFEDVFNQIKQNLKNEKTFEIYAKLKKYDKYIKEGYYQIPLGANNYQIIETLIKGIQTPVKLIVPSVRTIDILIAKIDEQLELTKEELLDILFDPQTLNSYGLSKHTVATLFIPNTYEVYWTISPKKLIERMYKEYNKFWNEERIRKAKKIGLTPTEVIILASIVQAEQMEHSEERPIIAGLYINRLKKGIPLQSDPTVLFALGQFDKKRVLFKDLEVNSPYNTYKNKGLPPGPILIPEISSIDAVLNYQKNDFLYMCAKEDFSGYHYFSKTIDEHLKYAQLYQKKLDEMKIKN